MSEKEEAVDLALCLWTGRVPSSNSFRASPPPEPRGLLRPREEEEGGDGSAGIAVMLDESRSKSPEDDEDSGGGGVRKKLRLSKEQSCLLEESFRQHNTLNPTEKRVLAERLNLRQRQVEVWFQNRRARTKLKQTEVDKEYLKRRCESLNDENQRLREELRELRSVKSSMWPMYIRPSNMTTMAMTTMLAMCPSCEKVVKGGTINDGAVTVAVKPKLYQQGVVTKDSNISCCK